MHVAGREIQRGEAIGIDPDAHRDRPAALEADALHARQGRELRLQRAREPVRHRGDVPLGRCEAEIERRVRPIGALHLDDRRLGFRRQLGAHLLQARGDLGERRRAVVVELQAHGDGADAGAAGRLDVVDAADRRHDALDRRGEEAADGLGAGAGVDRRDQHRRAFDARKLLHRQG